MKKRIAARYRSTGANPDCAETRCINGGPIIGRANTSLLATQMLDDAWFSENPDRGLAAGTYPVGSIAVVDVSAGNRMPLPSDSEAMRQC